MPSPRHADVTQTALERLAMVIDCAPIVAFALNARGVITFARGRGLDGVGPPPGDLVGRSMFELCANREDIISAVHRLLSGECMHVQLDAFGHTWDVRGVSESAGHSSEPEVVGVATDITEVAASQHAQSASEELYRTLVESSSDVINIVRGDGTVSYMSSAGAEMGGQPADTQPTGLNAVYEEDRPRIASMMTELIDRPSGTARAQYRIRHGDGTLHHLESTARNALDMPAVNGIIVSTRDITDLVRGREALQASEERFRELVQNSADVITVFAADGTRLYSSPAAATLYGVALEHVTQNVLESVHEEDRTRIAEAWADLLRRPGGTARVQYRIQRGDGTVRNVESSARNAVDNPAVNGLVIHTRDVTDLVRVQQELAGSEQRFRELVQNSSDVIAVFARDGARMYTSPSAATLYGIPLDQLPQTALASVHKEDQRRVAAVMRHIRDHSGSITVVRYRLQRPDGKLREVESTARNALDNPGVRGIVVNTRDITDAARAEALLSAQARVLTMIAAGVSLDETLAAITKEVEVRIPEVRCAIQLAGPDGSLRIAATVSREGLACALMEGRPLGPKHTICGVTLQVDREMLVGEPGASSRWRDSACLSGCGVKACWVTPIRRGASGAPVGVLSCYSSTPFEPGEDARQVVSTACELAAVAIDRNRFEDELRHHAFHDPMTGLPNRALLTERLSGDVARARRTATTGAVLFIDLDRFKTLNDSLGHESGDNVLKEMSERIAGQIRSEDTVARFGGDEFVVSCPDIGNEQEAIRLADRLLSAIRGPVVVRGQELLLTASIGIAIRRPFDTNVEAIVRNADAAMYRAKDRGRDRWEVFDTSLRRRALKRLRTDLALRKAVDAGDFEVWYQPVWSVSQNKVRSAEALVRWPQPGSRMAQPASFIPLAEELGLISKLGAWVLGRACADGAWLDREGCPVPDIAVNVSARQLTDGSLFAAIEEALATTGWDPHRLTVEVTESAIVVDPAAAMRTLKSLRGLGLRVALDDFGTGFSSLSYLKRFRYFDVIKIDRSFVSGLGNRRSADRAIIRAAVALAEALGATVVAEGVETANQLEALVSLGCDRMQGFLVARPMPIQALRDALIEQPWRLSLQRDQGDRRR